MQSVLAALFAAGIFVASAVYAATPRLGDGSLDVEGILSELSLEEKIELIGGDGKGFKGVARLGLPPVTAADAHLGVRGYGRATAFPASVGWAASWNDDLVAKIGRAVGGETRAKAIGILLGPGTNLYRIPQNGRNFEYFGEDPYLAGELVAAYVRALQSAGVVATPKHFVANNQEYDRHRADANVSERALRELYFPAFKAAIRQGGALSLMSAYNAVNGVQASASRYLLTTVLRDEWNFAGFVSSDWTSLYTTLGAMRSGVDLEMPVSEHFGVDRVMALIESGELDAADVDIKVRRILSALATVGVYAPGWRENAAPVDWGAHRELALEAAQQAIVLLKNAGDLLPLDASRKSIAVLGPNAHPSPTGGGGASYVMVPQRESYLAALHRVAGDAMDIVPVLTTPERHLRDSLPVHAAAGGAVGFRVAYFNNLELEGPPAHSEHLLASVAIRLLAGESPLPGAVEEKYSALIEGVVTPESDGDYEFVLEVDGGAKLYLDDALLMDTWLATWTGQISLSRQLVAKKTLKGGETYRLRIEYARRNHESVLGFGWGRTASSDLLADVGSHDAAIVFAGFNNTLETESRDRAFELPSGQDDLIARVLERQPNTVVVVNAGGAVDMQRWADRVPSILQAWYLGEAGGEALAHVLLGKRSPSGKLPISIERTWRDAPAHEYYDSAHSQPGVESHNIVAGRPHALSPFDYGEGIFVGYRHFDTFGIEPRFPFGHGLSYTRFRYGDLEIREGDGDNLWVVDFTVANVGERPAAEVAQLYVADEQSDLPRPAKELKGFRRIELAPGQTETLSIALPKESFSYFDNRHSAWRLQPGRFEVLVGGSSRDIQLRADVTIDDELFFQ